ncbi:MAG TPA: acetyl-CoA carboxylase biotin carboxyl carrier protein subunit [Chthonomonadaceae bacterium]|nr:acetyl-CoA carboxylase biotin carboxyl carrier protein subunit [Chthonomonadaceae bacterium]
MIHSSDVERLADLVRNANIREITLKNGDVRITIRKGASAARAADSRLAPFAPESAWEMVEKNGVGEAGVGSEESQLLIETVEGAEAEPTVWITAPLVGVFRHLKPLVGMGMRVSPGQVVGVIEAMKLINEIEADVEGVIVDVLVEDGQPVEYGQPLFQVRAES